VHRRSPSTMQENYKPSFSVARDGEFCSNLAGGRLFYARPNSHLASEGEVPTVNENHVEVSRKVRRR
jgi:hypothetical protein